MRRRGYQPPALAPVNEERIRTAQDAGREIRRLRDSIERIVKDMQTRMTAMERAGARDAVYPAGAVCEFDAQKNPADEIGGKWTELTAEEARVALMRKLCDRQIE